MLLMFASPHRSVLYVEGNLETKIFNDPITGLVRRIREIAIRRNGKFITVFPHTIIIALLLVIVLVSRNKKLCLLKVQYQFNLFYFLISCW